MMVGEHFISMAPVTLHRKLVKLKNYSVMDMIEQTSLTEDILYLRYVETKKDSICGMVMKN